MVSLTMIVGACLIGLKHAYSLSLSAEGRLAALTDQFLLVKPLDFRVLGIFVESKRLFRYATDQRRHEEL